jgi:hypothetical protein
MSTLAAVVNRLGSMWEATEPAHEPDTSEGEHEREDERRIDRGAQERQSAESER